MYVQSLNSNALLTLAQQLNSTTSVSSSTSSTSDSLDTASVSGAASSAPATVDISQGAQLLSKLQQLQQADPAKFKELMTKAAKQLEEAASKSTDDHEKKMLTDLASKFEKVADGTADLSSLAPPKPGSQGAPPTEAAYANTNSSSGIGSSATHQHKRSQAVEDVFQMLSQAVSTDTTSG